jgi:hypothetical protein
MTLSKTHLQSWIYSIQTRFSIFQAQTRHLRAGLSLSQVKYKWLLHWRAQKSWWLFTRNVTPYQLLHLLHQAVHNHRVWYSSNSSFNLENQTIKEFNPRKMALNRKCKKPQAAQRTPLSMILRSCLMNPQRLSDTTALKNPQLMVLFKLIINKQAYLLLTRQWWCRQLELLSLLSIKELTLLSRLTRTLTQAKSHKLLPEVSCLKDFLKPRQNKASWIVWLEEAAINLAHLFQAIPLEVAQPFSTEPATSPPPYWSGISLYHRLTRATKKTWTSKWIWLPRRVKSITKDTQAFLASRLIWKKVEILKVKEDWAIWHYWINLYMRSLKVWIKSVIAINVSNQILKMKYCQASWPELMRSSAVERG